MTQDEIVGWHHRHDGHEFGLTPGIGDGREAWNAAPETWGPFCPSGPWTELSLQFWRSYLCFSTQKTRFNFINIF